MVVAVPMSMVIMGAVNCSSADTAVRHNVRPHLTLDRQADIQSRFHAGPTTTGGLPSRRVSAFSIIKFSGGTTLHRMESVTSS